MTPQEQSAQVTKTMLVDNQVERMWGGQKLKVCSCPTHRVHEVKPNMVDWQFWGIIQYKPPFKQRVRLFLWRIYLFLEAH